MERKQAIILAVRIALSLGLLVLLYFLIPDFDVDELVPEVTTRTWVWVGGAFICTLAAMIMSVVRWREVGQIVGVTNESDGQPVRFRRYASHYFAGQFLSNFVPTTVGGDVLRVSRLSKDSGDSPTAFASVVFERLSGWLVLPAISLFGFALNPGLRTLGPATQAAFITGLVTLAALAVVIFVAASDRLGSRLERREGWVEWLNAIHLGIDALRAQPRQIWRVLGAGVGYQLMLTLAAGCAAAALGIEQVGITALMAFFPAVLILQVLPLGIGGLGVRESAFLLFFGPLGVIDERLIALGFLLYLLTIGASIVGLPALIFGGRKDAADEGPAPSTSAGGPVIISDH